MKDSQNLKLAATIFAPREAIAGELLPHAFDAIDGSHDVSHLSRVWRNATAISQSDGGDLDILLPAVILHDCVAVEKDSPQRAQASRMAADKASRVLKDMGFSTDLIFDIAHAIQAHSFSAGIEPRTLEAAILRDADRLDAIGAIGIARCFYISGRLGRPLYDLTDPKAESRPLDDIAFAADHFAVKLMGLSEGMLTQTGRKLAAIRRERMQRYLDEFFAEASSSA